MSSIYLDDRFDDEIWYDKYRECQGCGMELEPGEEDLCYICSSGFSFSDSQELKGGE